MYVCLCAECMSMTSMHSASVNLGCPVTVDLEQAYTKTLHRVACPFPWFALYTWDGEIVWISTVSSVLQLMLQEPFKLPNRSLPHKFGAYEILSN